LSRRLIKRASQVEILESRLPVPGPGEDSRETLARASNSASPLLQHEPPFISCCRKELVMVSPFMQLPIEIRLRILRFVLKSEVSTGRLVQASRSQCICRLLEERRQMCRFWSMLKSVILAMFRPLEPELCIWRTGHTSTASALTMGVLRTSRTLRIEAMDVLYNVTTIRLTSAEILSMMSSDDRLIDRFCNIIVSERHGEPAIALTTNGHSFYCSHHIIRTLRGQRLQMLAIDVDLLLAQNRSLGIRDAIHVASIIGLPTRELRCTGIGYYAYLSTGSLSKLKMYHGSVASSWEHAASLGNRQLRNMHETYHGDSFRRRSRNIWRQQGYRFPPLCQRVYLDFLFWLSDLRYRIIQAKRDGEDSEKLWREWLGVEDWPAIDILPGRDSYLYREWTFRLAYGLDMIRTWILSDE
jgi:hypothetical protein